MDQWIVGCTTRPYNELSYGEALARIGEAGYEHAALFAHQGVLPIRSDCTSAEVSQVRRAAADAGVASSMVLGRTQLDGGLDQAIDDYLRLIDNVAEIGACWLLDLGTSKEAHYEAYFQLMSRAALHAEEVGVHITMKPHGGISLTTEHLLEAVRRVGHPAFAISYDPGNIIYYTAGDRRPGADMVDIAPSVSTLIVKDCIIEDGKPDVMVTPGRGLVDFGLVWRQLRAGGFSGPSYVECVARGEANQVDRDLIHTLGFMRGIMAAGE